jgi:hypothetical protein
LGVNSVSSANVNAFSFAPIRPTDDDPVYGNDGDDYPVGALTLFVSNESLRSLFTDTSSRNQNSLGQTLLRSIGFFIF